MITRLNCGPGLIVNSSEPEPVPLAFVALSVTINVPAVVGVPVMAPVCELTVRPEGRPVAPKLVGLSVAVI